MVLIVLGVLEASGMMSGVFLLDWVSCLVSMPGFFLPHCLRLSLFCSPSSPPLWTSRVLDLILYLLYLVFSLGISPRASNTRHIWATVRGYLMHLKSIAPYTKLWGPTSSLSALPSPKVLCLSQCTTTLSHPWLYLPLLPPI